MRESECREERWVKVDTCSWACTEGIQTDHLQSEEAIELLQSEEARKGGASSLSKLTHMPGSAV